MSTTSEEASTLVPGWEWLPTHLLDLILEKLIQTSDHIRLSVVCKHWHSAALHLNQQRLRSFRQQLPMLMVPTRESSEERRCLYNVTQGKTYNFELFVPYNKRCCGSSHGWLACANTVDKNLVLALLNPFTGRSISLPHLLVQTEPSDLKLDHNMWERFPDYSIHKIVLSADPCLFPNDYEALLVYERSGGKIAHYKAGDDGWTHIEERMNFSDAVYHKDQFLAVSFDGLVFSVNASSDTTTAKPYISIVVEQLREVFLYGMVVRQGRTYLAESSGRDLLLIREFERLNVPHWSSTTTVKVFKLQCASGDRPESVEEIESIGNDALFLGENQSICVSTLDFPGCHPNYIYLSMDDRLGLPYNEAQGPIAMAAFNIKTGRMESEYYCFGRPKKYMPPSIWILPAMV